MYYESSPSQQAGVQLFSPDVAVRFNDFNKSWLDRLNDHFISLQ